MESNVVCPVCTLFLRPGITLKAHLTTHPKQQVIDAMVKKLEHDTSSVLGQNIQEIDANATQYNTAGNWNAVQGGIQLTTPFQGNHVFYQQSMSTSQTNPLGAQQYVIPAVLNPQMMPYVYQQQQLIMSSGAWVPLNCFNPMLTSSEQFPPICPSSPKADKETLTIPADIPVEVEVECDAAVVDELKNSDNNETDTTTVKWNNLNSIEELNKACQTVVDKEEIKNLENDESNVGTRGELEKACQTAGASRQLNDDAQRKEYYYFNNVSENAVPYEEQSGPIYTSVNILQATEHVDDLERMPFMCDFPVVLFENQDAMIQDNVVTDVVDVHKDDFDVDESISRGSVQVNIRADERMPPRGELSGQESLGGASDINWNRLHEGTSSTPYEHLSRETWENSSDIELLQTRVAVDEREEEENEMPSIVGYNPPPLNFKCSRCDEAFPCLQDRKAHDMKVHGPSKREKTCRLNLVGAHIGTKKPKKLVIRLKTEKTESSKLDNVFTNKIKTENLEQQQKCKLETGNTADARTICSLCGDVFENAVALKLHESKAHQITSSVRYKCSTCAECFPNESSYQIHLKIHPLECRLCGKLFYRVRNRQLHLKRHMGIKPYRCDLCVKSFLTKQKLTEHRNVHTGNAPIKCTMCSESFRRHSNLVQHRNRHHLKVKRKTKDYVCPCGEIFHSLKKLAWHKETHDSKPKACTQCSEKFIHSASLTRHMRKAHNERFLPEKGRTNQNVECPICKGVFLKTSLDMHLRTHTGSKPYSCPMCNKDFTTRWNLKQHKWTHESRLNKPFKCDQCNGAFVRETDYVSHMNSHKNVKPYTCNYCGAKFIRKYNCQRHVKEHEHAKTFTCTVCNKSFHRSYYLKDHMKVHNGDRPFTCHVCGKTSTTKSNHNKHIRIHHAREPINTEN